MVSDAHLRLRAATRHAHRQLEERTAILDRVRSRAGRAEVVRGFYRLHAEAEAAAEPWLAAIPGLDFEGRRRTARLANDLRALGSATPSVARDALRIDHEAGALGLLYVLEGSSLGGQVIRRQVGDLTGLSFLDPYGARTGERWRAFLAVLTASLPRPSDVEAAVAGALAGFRHAELRLCGEGVRG